VACTVPLRSLRSCCARSPKLKLNFSRFGGILIGVYNAAVKNKHLGEVHTGSVLESGRDHTEKHTVSNRFFAAIPISHRFQTLACSNALQVLLVPAHVRFCALAFDHGGNRPRILKFEC